ncbi:MAG: sialidase family protein [bacterium]
MKKIAATTGVFALLLCVFASVNAHSESKPFYRDGLIFPIGNAGFKSCHGSTLIELSNGDILAAWYGGDYERAHNVKIYAARMNIVTGEWTKPWIIQETPGLSEGNPVLWLSPDKKTVWLFFVTIMKETWNDARMFYKKSTDEGKTWGEHVTLIEKLGWMTRNKPLVLKNGDILLPIYNETMFYSQFFISKDGGTNWDWSGPLRAPGGIIQPSVVQLSDGSLLTVMRTGSGNGLAWWSRSANDGKKWTKPYTTDIKNPMSAADMVTLPNGHIALVYNDSAKERNPLTVAISTDEGKTWPVKRDIENAPNGSFGYPAVIATSDGVIHVTYSYSRDSIKYAAFDEAWATEKQ